MSNTSSPHLPPDESDTSVKSDLRRQAEKKAALSPEFNKCLSLNETRVMIHELRVHQIELEMQNEELRQTQEELNASRVRYFDLYDLAPAGYLTLCNEGLILESNLCAATLLGVLRSALVGKPISNFLLKGDQDIYYTFRKQLFATGEPQMCELRMVNSDDVPFWAQLSGTVARNGEGKTICRVVLIDITERKRAENEVQQKCNELERINNVTTGRELRMIELKSEINALLQAAGQPEKYKIIGEDD
jgi:PAS domain S-box-containing protein